MLINEIILDDCMNCLSNLPSDSIDFICIDPPYEINYNGESWDEKIINWIYLFSEFKRILKDSGNVIIFQGWSNVCETICIGKNYFNLKNWMIYDRIKGRGAKTNLVSTREDILWFTKTDSYTFNKIPSNIKKRTKGFGNKNGESNRALTNVWYDISPLVPWSKERNIHPTQKPIQLMERLVNIYSNENDLVFDCFAGSGSTLIAARNLNRRFLGIEQDPTYYNICKKRLQDSLLNFI